jgi:hypothetical protein
LPYLCYIKEAANRFWVFYVIARKSQNGDFHIMTRDGNFLSVPEIQWTGKFTYRDA